MKRVTTQPLLVILMLQISLTIGSLKAQHLPKAHRDALTELTNIISMQGYELEESDILVTDVHTSAHNGVTHVYFVQTYQGVPIAGTLSNVAYRDKAQVVTLSSKFDIKSSNFSTQLTAHSATQSVISLARYLDYPFASAPGRVLKSSKSEVLLTELPYARGDVQVSPIWALHDDGLYYRSWRIDLDAKVSSDHYDAIVSGLNGKVISAANQTVSCRFHKEDAHKLLPSAEDRKEHRANNIINTSAIQEQAHNALVDNSSYRVFAPPLESPLNGDRTLVREPADPVASPNGWHDVDNSVGPDYTITRGNNTHAYQDPEDDDNSNGDEPDGGATLTFDFPFSRDSTPESNLNADVTNLFFWNNYLHDWSYKFGFNEAAGNFQEDNFGRGGRAGDHVNAQTLDGGDTGNANFSAPRDGDFGRMQMYKWIVGNDISVLSPSTIMGNFNTGGANFGPTQSNAISGIAALATDGVGATTDACEMINNSEDIRGKIALIDRGTCDFSAKVFRAQSAGAIAAVVCNNLDDAPLVTMNGGENATEVTIPSLFLSKEDCQLIKDEIDRDVELRFNESFELSSSFDNGIVAHEYAHGISLRLIGGASNSGCLNNDEQVGEGWSDFFTLVLTQGPNDTGDLPRGIGNYVIGQNTNGPGIRRYRYSTDKSINPQIHSHVRASRRPHAFGEIWTSALWDMYWNFIEQDGYDPTWQDREAGNYKAVQVIIDGMKLQGCNADILEARDAVLSADQLNYFGENEELIWRSFASRGLGYDAVAGADNSRYDNIDGFQLPPEIANELQFEKNMTSTVDVGETVTVELSVSNYKEDLQNVVITDLVPTGLELIISSSDEFTVDGDKVIFNLGDVNDGQEITKSYQLSTASVQAPDFQLFDNFEGPLGFIREQSNDDLKSWNVTTVRSAGGIFSLRMVGDTLSGESYAINKEAIEIGDNNKLLKFQHRFNAELGIDGGVVEISTDNGTTWDFVPASQFLVRPYNDVVTFNNRYTETTPAFTGVDPSWDASVIDLSQYAGESILVRFRYIQERFVETEITEGWAIDNFEIYDRKEFSSTAQLQSGEDMLLEDSSSVYINSDARSTPTNEVKVEELSFHLSPNPTLDQIAITYLSAKRGEVQLQIINSNGQVLINTSQRVSAGQNEISVDISNLPSGVYNLKLESDQFSKLESFVKAN